MRTTWKQKTQELWFWTVRIHVALTMRIRCPQLQSYAMFTRLCSLDLELEKIFFSGTLHSIHIESLLMRAKVSWRKVKSARSAFHLCVYDSLPDITCASWICEEQAVIRRQRSLVLLSTSCMSTQNWRSISLSSIINHDHVEARNSILWMIVDGVATPYCLYRCS